MPFLLTPRSELLRGVQFFTPNVDVFEGPFGIIVELLVLSDEFPELLNCRILFFFLADNLRMRFTPPLIIFVGPHIEHIQLFNTRLHDLLDIRVKGRELCFDCCHLCYLSFFATTQLHNTENRWRPTFLWGVLRGLHQQLRYHESGLFFFTSPSFHLTRI